MNKEERKAIEDMNRFANGIDMSCVTARQMQIILNLIEKLQKENEEWDRKFCDLQNLYFKLQDESELKRKEYQETYKDVREELKELKKENEELKEKESRIYKEVQESLSFEKFLIAKDIGPDLFNLGRFYISQIIYDILNNAENPEGIHKENKYIKHIDYISVQKVKDKMEEYKNMLKTCNKAKDIDRIKAINERILELQELLEGRK